MGRRRTKEQQLGATLTVPTSAARDRDSDLSDMESIAYSSVVGDVGSVDEDFAGEMDLLVDGFSEQIERAQDKKIATRLKAIAAVCTTMKRHYLPELVGKWKLTLGEIVEKSLKRSPEETTFACGIAALLCLQLGAEMESDIQALINSMRAMVADPAIADPLRSLIAQALGICVYVSCEHQFNTQYETLQSLRGVWASVKMNSEQHLLFSGALSAWVLLLERLDPHLLSAAISDSQPKICTYLESPCVEIRMAAGEALAGLHELGVRRLDDAFRFQNSNHLEVLLENLSLDSSKHRAKRDKKVQKFTIRQVQDAIFSLKEPQSRVHFNKHETLQLDGFHQQLLYSSLCGILKGDANRHLTQNEVLRSLFDLGPPIERATGLSGGKNEKLERMNQLAANNKARNIRRGKQRGLKGGVTSQCNDD